MLEVKSLVESGKSPKVGFHRVIKLNPKSLVKISGKYTPVFMQYLLNQRLCPTSCANRSSTAG